MNDFVLRAAQPQDQDAIREITLAAYAQYADVMPAFAWNEYRKNIAQTLARVVPPVEQIVAERAGEILGTVLLLPAGTELVAPDESIHVFQFPEVRLLAVAPSARGQGIGAALMRECVDRARRAGAKALTLHTTDMMQTAMQMYERMGFVRAPETDFFPTPEITVKGYQYALIEN